MVVPQYLCIWNCIFYMSFLYHHTSTSARLLHGEGAQIYFSVDKTSVYSISREIYGKKLYGR